MSEATPEAAASPEMPAEPDVALEATSDADAPELDEHTQKVVDAIRNDFKAERARRQAAEKALEDAKPKLSEYDKLVEASKSDLERAQEAMKAANERATGMLRDVATAKVEAALSALPDDIRSTLLEDINVERFIKDDTVDAEAIGALREKYAAFAATPGKPGMKPNPAQGSSAGPPLTIAQQIAAATQAGDTRTAMRLKASQALNPST